MYKYKRISVKYCFNDLVYDYEQRTLSPANEFVFERVSFRIRKKIFTDYYLCDLVHDPEQRANYNCILSCYYNY